jgi:hypothetical protein
MGGREERRQGGSFLVLHSSPVNHHLKRNKKTPGKEEAAHVRVSRKEEEKKNKTEHADY